MEELGQEHVFSGVIPSHAVPLTHLTSQLLHGLNCVIEALPYNVTVLGNGACKELVTVK